MNCNYCGREIGAVGGYDASFYAVETPCPFCFAMYYCSMCGQVIGSQPEYHNHCSHYTFFFYNGEIYEDWSEYKKAVIANKSAPCTNFTVKPEWKDKENQAILNWRL